jgi:hypothetical protein
MLPSAGVLPEIVLGSREKRELVRRVVQSQIFAGSQALRGFLSFITEQAIAGNSEKIKEQRIGSEVLGRKPDYDPATDNIVRVRAHELRQRLEKYFATEGAHEPVVISIPKGTYVPEFHPRMPVPVVEVEPFVPVSRPSVVRHWIPWIVACSLAVALLVTLSRGRAQTASPPTLQDVPAMRDFWGQFFRQPGEELMAVSADSGFALWQDITGRNLNLGDYLGRKYLLMDVGDRKLRELAARRCTSPADLSISLRLSEMSKSFGGHLNPQYARNITVREFRKANVVLIGSRRSNPWVELFEPRLNFVLARDPMSGAPLFMNKKPRPGEASAYGMPGMFDADGTEQKELESYALIALIPGLSDAGSVVLIEGLNMEATEAAGEMATDAGRLNAMLDQMGHRTGTPVAPFETLLKLTSVPGGYTHSKAIAFRYHRGE